MTDTTIDNATETVAKSQPTASDTSSGDPQGSVPASVDPTAIPSETPETESARAAKRESRAFATIRRENRELHRSLGRMEARLEALGRPAPAQPEGDAPPQQRQTFSPQEVAAQEADRDAAETVMERLEESGVSDEVMKTITKPNFPINVVMRDFLGDTDRPAEMAQWLADNPDEARRISRLSPVVALRALERAEAKIAKPAPKISTRAPAPPQTVQGGASAPSSIERMSYSDLLKWTAKEGRRN